MGFLNNLVSATVKTIITPIAIAKDVVNVSIGEKAESTKKHVESIIQDVEDSLENIV